MVTRYLIKHLKVDDFVLLVLIMLAHLIGKTDASLKPYKYKLKVVLSNVVQDM